MILEWQSTWPHILLLPGHVLVQKSRNFFGMKPHTTWCQASECLQIDASFFPGPVAPTDYVCGKWHMGYKAMRDRRTKCGVGHKRVDAV